MGALVPRGVQGSIPDPRGWWHPQSWGTLEDLSSATTWAPLLEGFLLTVVTENPYLKTKPTHKPNTHHGHTHRAQRLWHIGCKFSRVDLWIIKKWTEELRSWCRRSSITRFFCLNTHLPFSWLNREFVAAMCEFSIHWCHCVGKKRQVGVLKGRWPV